MLADLVSGVSKEISSGAGELVDEFNNMTYGVSENIAIKSAKPAPVIAARHIYAQSL